MTVYTVRIPLLGAKDTDELGIYDSLELAVESADAAFLGDKLPIWYSSAPMKGKPYRYPVGSGIVKFPVHDYECITIAKREVQTKDNI